MSSTLRFQVVGEAFKKKPVEIPNREERPSEYFAKYVFNRQKMFKYLPSKVYAKMCDVIDNGTKLYNLLRGIQYGIEPDTHNWTRVVIE